MQPLAQAEALLQQWLLGLGPVEAAGWAVLLNLAQVLACVVGGWALQRPWPDRRIAPAPPALTVAEVQTTALTVLGSAAITWLGWWAFCMGWIVVVPTSGPLRAVGDAVGLLLTMDAALYAGHRMAHWGPLFGRVHALHHRYSLVRPLTLFVVHPAEVLGFGGLWLGVLALWQPCWSGMIAYLMLNGIWGTLGHFGMELLPGGPALLTGGRHHADHHRHPHGNFGFYTNLWDRLLGSRLPRPEP